MDKDICLYLNKMNHDIRDSLNVISGLAHLIQRENGANSKMCQACEMINESVFNIVNTLSGVSEMCSEN